MIVVRGELFAVSIDDAEFGVRQRAIALRAIERNPVELPGAHGNAVPVEVAALSDRAVDGFARRNAGARGIIAGGIGSGGRRALRGSRMRQAHASQNRGARHAKNPLPPHVVLPPLRSSPAPSSTW